MRDIYPHAYTDGTYLHSYRLCPGLFLSCSPACSVFVVSLLTIISAVRLYLTAFLFPIAHVIVVVLCGNVWFGFCFICLGSGHLLSYRQKSYSGLSPFINLYFCLYSCFGVTWIPYIWGVLVPFSDIYFVYGFLPTSFFILLIVSFAVHKVVCVHVCVT